MFDNTLAREYGEHGYPEVDRFWRYAENEIHHNLLILHNLLSVFVYHARMQHQNCCGDQNGTNEGWDGSFDIDRLFCKTLVKYRCFRSSEAMEISCQVYICLQNVGQTILQEQNQLLISTGIPNQGIKRTTIFWGALYKQSKKT